MKKDRKNYFGLIFSLIFLFIILIGINIKYIENFNQERLLEIIGFGIFIIFGISMYEGFSPIKPEEEPDTTYKTGHILIYSFLIIGVILIPFCLYIYSKI